MGRPMPARVRRVGYMYVIVCPECHQGERRRTHNAAHMLKAAHNRTHVSRETLRGAR